MRSATYLATGATEYEQHQTDDQYDDAGGPQDPDAENETEEKKYKSENNHASRVPPATGLQTGWRRRRPEGGFSSLQPALNPAAAS